MEITTMNTEPSNCQQLTARPVDPAAWPAIPTICSVEMFAATIEIPISGHVSPRPARKKSELSSSCPFAFRLFQTLRPTTITKKPMNTARSWKVRCMDFWVVLPETTKLAARYPWNIG